MLEAFMLILLGAGVMALIALALAPMLWSRAARVTSQRVQQDVHSAAFSEASQHVSKRYEGKIAERESALRAEIAQLEASRESISTEAANRVSSLEQTRARLEQEIAARDARLAESERLFQELAQSVRSLGEHADVLDRAHHDIAGSAYAPEEHPAQQPDMPEDQQPVTAQAVSQQVAREPEPTHDPVAEEHELAVAQIQAEQNQVEKPAMPDLPRETTLSDRIRALRDGVSA